MHTHNQTIKLKLLLILATAFCLRLALIVLLKTYIHPVTWEHEVLANNLLSGAGYSFTQLKTNYWSFATPLYAFLCAGIYRISNHGHFTVLVVQSVFSIALGLAIFKIAKRLFGERAGLLAAAMTCFHPGFIYYDVFNLMPLSIEAFLIAAFTLMLLKYRDRPSAATMLVIGGLAGLATLSRGILGMLLPFAVIYLLGFVRELQVRTRLVAASYIIAGTLLVLSPWLIRNYTVHRQLLLSTSSGELFWRGNNRLAVGTSYDSSKTPIFILWPDEFKNRVYRMTELEQNAFLRNEARQFIRENPRQAFGLYLKKVYYFWWFSPQSGIIYSQRYALAYKLYYGVLLAFALVGIATAMRSSPREEPLVLICLMLTLSLAQSLFFVEGRHRWLIEPLLLVFFSYGVLRTWQEIRRRAAKQIES